MILLISVIYSVVDEARSIPTLKSKEGILRRLAVAKSQIEGLIRAYGVYILSYRINDYYASLRYVCTTIHGDSPPEFSEELWAHWQLEGAPRSSKAS